nr:MAG: ORF1 [Torque teno midi virus]UHM27235.1 MAG: ORF1 [Torque teno midi virus]UHM27249.1 MAG: ORF1 [Torque teno midi virus]
MPFWWGRRKRFWYSGNRRWKRRPRTRRRKLYTRRRFTRANRFRRKRRRKRRKKVRRKKQTIPVRQWQPDSIRKCKIKGLGILVLGAEGTQIDCYTTEIDTYVPPKVPWGGGFGLQNITLNYLYEEYVFTNNIWTASNILKDLCRYLKCKVTFFRHPDTDFVVSYIRQPPYILNKFTYPSCHPQQMLLQKHKKVILSHASKTNGKYKVNMHIKPPKQMITKWFFTKDFTDKTLVILKGAAANMRYSHLSGKNQNMQTTIYSLNTSFFQIPDWAQAKSTYYRPYGTAPAEFQYKNAQGQIKTLSYGKITTGEDVYYHSINYTTGIFTSDFLLAQGITKDSGHPYAVRPTITSRYNPNLDKGKGNEVFVISTLQQSWQNPSDKQFYIADMPLWLALYGYYSYIKSVKPKDYILAHVVVIKSSAIYCYPEIGSCTYYCPIDWLYLNGKKPYSQIITSTQKRLWYPDMNWQKQTLNAIVESGPFIPQYSEETYSTWELKYNYLFYFKWGGPQTEEPEIKNPKDLDTYDVPDTIQKTIQIANPAKQTTESILHPWDWRRGFIKERALKRMYEHLETDSEYEHVTEETPQKKQRKGAALRDPQEETQEIEACLQGLCKKSIFQEQTDQDLQLLIQQQQQQQEELKYNILRLLFDLKHKQAALQHHTGLID